MLESFKLVIKFLVVLGTCKPCSKTQDKSNRSSMSPTLSKEDTPTLELNSHLEEISIFLHILVQHINWAKKGVQCLAFRAMLTKLKSLIGDSAPLGW